jgi:hypothetical protein
MALLRTQGVAAKRGGRELPSMIACCCQECLGGGKGSQAKLGQSSSNDRGADHYVKGNFNITVVYVAEPLLRSSDSFRARSDLHR